jgi:hypothetical protein
VAATAGSSSLEARSAQPTRPRRPHGASATSPPRSRSCARGVEVLDLPDLDTVDGIADVGFALAAWIVDPDGNWIGLPQLK